MSENSTGKASASAPSASAPDLRVEVTWTPSAQASLKALEARGLRLALDARRKWNAALKLGARECVAQIAARAEAAQWAQQHRDVPWALDATFVSDEEMRELNARFRSKNRPTDVLSFSQAETAPLDRALLEEASDSAEEDALSQAIQWPGALPGEEDEVREAVLGDLVIAVETAQRQAGERAHEGDVEVLFLAIHGTLHLLGYDHQTSSGRRAMWREQEALFNRLRLEVERSKGKKEPKAPST